MNVAQLIETMRKRSGKSRRTLAKEMNVSVQSVRNWEDGRNAPSAETLLLIARQTGHELIFRRKPKPFYGGEHDDNSINNSGITPTRGGYRVGPRDK